ncbi:hypothetical protein DOM22_13810 [Bdellovibrio sp. ZAP7]|uniref:hypothetical protein n=1 Tax=Bdellovibrio sp. ZAP7 TaxID=2231053 RepID=UPI0011573996|nr:hypothetical protein [Bdellovibrio sp. ZAP7]QDK46161.1 hypothetical protein DOM22_13810 [Bdellovibrio sp. ZAP7]
MKSCFKIFFAVLFFSPLSQAIELNILQPNYRCQSKEFITDNTLALIVLQDKVSGLNHIEIEQAWFGGIRRAYFEVSERVEKNGDRQPVIFEGSGIKLAIEHAASTTSEQHPLQAVLQIPLGNGEVKSEMLICESLL